MRIGTKKNKYLPRDLTEEKLALILKDVADGAPYKYAAESNFISERHLYYMLAQGVVDMEDGNFETIYAKLVQGLRDIEKKEIIECRSGVRVSEKGHIGKQWTLEKVYWHHFGGNAPIMELAKEMRLEKEKLKNEVRDKAGYKEGDEESCGEGQEGRLEAAREDGLQADAGIEKEGG